ncbi:MAG: ABC transporter substrate-binding protein [Acidobacteriota bacterium]|nr:ABC transporter substrate-binding protein [Acidobacteriota bacterium]
MRFRPLLALLLLFGLACERGEKPVAAASSVPTLDTSKPQDGGTLVRRLNLDITTLNPVVMASRYDRYVANYLFTPVLYLDRNLQPIPGLADSWEISEDGLTYRFKLNPKATFSDGRPVLASDVLFTLKKIADPKTEAIQAHGAFASLDIAKTRVIDDSTLEVVFRERLAAQLIRFNDVLVVPEHVYSIGDFRKGFNDRAVGSGPYALVRREAGKEVVLQRRKDYWGVRPHIETVMFKVVDDHGTAFNALKLGDLDESLITSDTWLRESKNPQTTQLINFQRFYTLNYNYIAWNNRNPILKDKSVRRAMSMCIPLDVVVQELFQGTARAMSGPFTADEWAYNPTVPVIKYDPPEAQRLLAAAGWKDTNGDGVLDKDGKPFQFSLIAMTGGATSKQIAQLVQSELKKIGVQADINMMEGGLAISSLMKGNFDAAYLSWDLDADPDPHAIFHSSSFPGSGGQNFVFYSNPEADRIIEEARHELDLSKRKDLYWRLHEIMAEDQPYTWIVQVSAKWGLNRRVQGVVSSRGFGFFQWYPGELGWWLASPPSYSQPGDAQRQAGSETRGDARASAGS